MLCSRRWVGESGSTRSPWRSGLGGVISPQAQSYDMFLGTALPALGQAVLSRDGEAVGRAGLSWSLLESFLPGLKPVGCRNRPSGVARKTGTQTGDEEDVELQTLRSGKGLGKTIPDSSFIGMGPEA